MNPEDYKLLPDSRDSLRQLELLCDGGGIADSTRSQFAASLLLTIWQLAGPTFTRRPPSFLLVHAESGADPILEVLNECAEWHRTVGSRRVPGAKLSWIYQDNEDQAREEMKTALTIISRSYSSKDPDAEVDPTVPKWMKQWTAMKAHLFRCPEVTPLGEAWDPDFGVVTGPDDYLSLLVRDDADLLAFNHKQRGRTPELISPRGYDEEAKPVEKRVAVLGGISSGSWDSRIYHLGTQSALSTIFLPHVGGRLPDVPATAWASMVSSFARAWRDSGRRLSIPSECTPMVGPPAIYDEVLFRQLSAMPGYAFRLMKIARDLQWIVQELVEWAATQSGSRSRDREGRCALKLYFAALRGLCYGAGASAFFPRTWGSEREQDHAYAILDLARSKGTISRRDIQVKYPRIAAKRRDPLLTILEHLRLIELEGTSVHAIALKNYLSRIPSRCGFPVVDRILQPRLRFPTIL